MQNLNIQSLSKLIAIFCIIVILNSNIAFAQLSSTIDTERTQTIWGEEETGESIFIIIDGYEPRIVPANIIDDQDVPVYVYLKGTTLGGVLAGDGSPNMAPFYGVPEIQDVQIRAKDISSQKFFAGYNYIKPRRRDYLSSDGFYDLGYLIINLRKIEKEDEVPDRIDLNMSARIRFDLDSNFGDYGTEDLVLKESIDEQSWLQGEKNSFWGGSGYVRASRITDGSVNLNIYDSYLRKIGGLTLKPGETSERYFKVRYGNSLYENKFRIRLNEITSYKDKATISLFRDGKIDDKILSEGMRLYAGSSWVVDKINRYALGNTIIEEVILENKEEKEINYLRRESGGVKTSFTFTYYGADTFNWHKKYNEGAYFWKLYQDGVYVNTEEKEEGKSLFILDEYLTNSCPQDVWAKYSNYITVSSEKYNIPIPLIIATICTENPGFDENLHNANDGYGLMQVLESTAKTVTGNTELEGEDMFDPELSISVGTHYIKQKKSVTGFDPVFVAAVYNSGGLYKNIENSNWCLQSSSNHIDRFVSFFNLALRDVDLGLELSEEIESVECTEDDYVDIKNFNSFDGLSSKEFYCSAIEEFSRVIEKGESSVVKDAYYFIGLSYKELGNYQKAIENFEEITGGSYFNAAVKQIEDARELLNSNVVERKVYLDDEGVSVILKHVDIVSEEDKATAYIRVDGGEARSYTVGKELTTSGYGIGWYVKYIKDKTVVIEGTYYDDDKEKTKTETLSLTRGVIAVPFNGKSVGVELTELDSKEEAYITILPGSGRAVSETDFSIHIPIEQRGIKFSDEQIDQQINWTEEKIEEMNKLIKTLDNIVQFGNKLCWSIFAFVTLKNFFSGSALRKARQLAMHGIDGESGITKICQEKTKGFGAGEGEYASYDQCLWENREVINGIIDETKEAINENKKIEDINKFEVTISGEDETVDYKDFEVYGTGEYVEHVREDVINLNILEHQRDICEESDSDLCKALTPDLEEQISDIKKNLGEYHQASEKGNDYIEAYMEKYKDEFEKLSEDQQKKQKEKMFNRGYTDHMNPPKTKVSDVGELKGETLYEKIIEFDAKGELYFTEYENGSLTIVYVTPLLNEKQEEVFTEDDYPVYVEKGETLNKYEKLYYSTRIYYTDGIYGVFNDECLKVEYHEDGRPMFIPTSTAPEDRGKGGNYIDVEDWSTYGRVTIISLWNVGSNGCPGDSDDIQIFSDSQLKDYERLGKQSLYSNLRSSLKREAENVKTISEEGEEVYVQSLGKKLVGSYAKSRLKKTLNQVQCVDVMSISDCQLLFNFCDPVMCPPSRFNFGGRYQVTTSVVETGLFGSLILGMPNWFVFSGMPQIIPPVCVTGVDASAKAYRSMLQGYNECLKISRAENENVGICEKIRSVFWCELAYREVTGLLQAKGSIIDVAVSKIAGLQGGGELFSLREQAKSIEDSAKFFTENYAKNAFAAYKARTTTEIGTVFCKAAFYAKGPWFGDFWNELTKPESPPQFTAFFDEKPWATKAGLTTRNIETGLLSQVEEQSAYSVYYHIYAGEDQDVRYSVFLKDEYGNIAYVTERLNGRYGLIPKGDYVDKTIDFIGRSGYTEICVMINGKLECGFGKSSSSFGLNRIGDELVRDDAYRQISSAEECVPEYIGPMVDVAGVPLAVPSGLGYTNNGIIRVCSVGNPGLGVNEEDYRNVGTCDKDEFGRDLGDCWVDVRSVTRAVKSVDIKEDITETFVSIGGLSDEVTKNYFDKLEEIFLSVFDKEYNLININNNYNFVVDNQIDIKKVDEFLEVIEPLVINHYYTTNINGEKVSYRDISLLSFGEYGAKSQLRIGQIYLAIGNLLNELEDKKEAKEDIDLSLVEEEEKEGCCTFTDLIFSFDTPSGYDYSKETHCETNKNVCEKGNDYGKYNWIIGGVCEGNFCVKKDEKEVIKGIDEACQIDIKYTVFTKFLLGYNFIIVFFDDQWYWKYDVPDLMKTIFGSDEQEEFKIIEETDLNLNVDNQVSNVLNLLWANKYDYEPVIEELVNIINNDYSIHLELNKKGFEEKLLRPETWHLTVKPEEIYGYCLTGDIEEKIEESTSSYIDYNEYGEFFILTKEGFDILFKFDSDEVRSIDDIKLYLNFFVSPWGFNDFDRIQIIGYASEEGTEEYNQVLSEARAKSVKDVIKDHLLSYNFDVEYDFSGKGETIEFGEGVDNYPLNRRVTVKFLQNEVFNTYSWDCSVFNYDSTLCNEVNLPSGGKCEVTSSNTCTEKNS